MKPGPERDQMLVHLGEMLNHLIPEAESVTIAAAWLKGEDRVVQVFHRLTTEVKTSEQGVGHANQFLERMEQAVLTALKTHLPKTEPIKSDA